MMMIPKRVRPVERKCTVAQTLNFGTCVPNRPIQSYNVTVCNIMKFLVKYIYVLIRVERFSFSVLYSSIYIISHYE